MALGFNKNQLFTYYPSKNKLSVLISIPHSGTLIPEEFKQYLTEDITHLSQDVDYKVDELIYIEKLQSHGIGVIVALIHRICVDLNRAPENAVLFWINNTRGGRWVT